MILPASPSAKKRPAARSAGDARPEPIVAVVFNRHASFFRTKPARRPLWNWNDLGMVVENRRHITGHRMPALPLDCRFCSLFTRRLLHPACKKLWVDAIVITASRQLLASAIDKKVCRITLDAELLL